MDTRPIGVFDSGCGGLTVVSEIIKSLPNENIIYLGDTKQFPYGNKSKETIVELSKKNIEFLLSKNVKAIVIACGTATSQALEEVKRIYEIPIIGIIEPTIISILKNEKPNRIGIMATTGTIRSNAWEKEIKKYNPDVYVVNKACPLLAQMAEEGWTDNEIAKLTIHEYVRIFKDNPVEKLILGCTHYPLFYDIIKKELGEKVEIVNTGKKVVEYLRSFLRNTNSLNEDENYHNNEFYLTDMETDFLRVAKNLMKSDITIKKAEIK